MPNAGHYSQEDEPETLIKIIKQFMLANDNIK
jgi:pimeloyl-ACP methyl ester carboxylesterase